jgi:hypothetical protein
MTNPVPGCRDCESTSGICARHGQGLPWVGPRFLWRVSVPGAADGSTATKGWECPKCGLVMAPWMPVCAGCKAAGAAKENS